MLRKMVVYVDYELVQHQKLYNAIKKGKNNYKKDQIYECLAEIVWNDILWLLVTNVWNIFEYSEFTV